MTYTTYAIKSLTRNYIYVGLTNNLKRRLDQHQTGKEKTTRSYRPYGLIYKKDFNTRVEAREHEKFLKSGIGKEYLRAQVAELADALP